MSEIEGEVVDTQESSEATEPVETTDSVEASEPAAEAAPAEETVEETTDSEPSVVDWNGEVKSLGDAEWFNSIEESSRQALLQGIETKYKNWQRGYTKAFEENATKRKSLEDRETGIAAQEARVTRWLYGEGDPIGDLKKELDGLKSTHEERLAALKEEHEKSVGQASTNVMRLSDASPSLRLRSTSVKRASWKRQSTSSRLGSKMPRRMCTKATRHSTASVFYAREVSTETMPSRW